MSFVRFLTAAKRAGAAPTDRLVEMADDYDSAIPDDLPLGDITYPLYLETEDRRQRGLPIDVLSLAESLHFSVDQLLHGAAILESRSRLPTSQVDLDLSAYPAQPNVGEEAKDYRVPAALLLRVLAERFRTGGSSPQVLLGSGDTAAPTRDEGETEMPGQDEGAA